MSMNTSKANVNRSNKLCEHGMLKTENEPLEVARRATDNKTRVPPVDGDFSFQVLPPVIMTSQYPNLLLVFSAFTPLPTKYLRAFGDETSSFPNDSIRTFGDETSLLPNYSHVALFEQIEILSGCGACKYILHDCLLRLSPSGQN